MGVGALLEDRALLEFLVQFKLVLGACRHYGGGPWAPFICLGARVDGQVQTGACVL